MTYVTMTDEFMSGWGPAKGKENILIFECQSEEEAKKLKNYAQKREEMHNVFISDVIPPFNELNYYVQIKNRTDSPMWYKKGEIKMKNEIKNEDYYADQLQDCVEDYVSQFMKEGVLKFKFKTNERQSKWLDINNDSLKALKYICESIEEDRITRYMSDSL